jgi:hypothetical protein
MEERKEVAFRKEDFVTNDADDVTQDNKDKDGKTKALLEFTGTGFTDLTMTTTTKVLYC